MPRHEATCYAVYPDGYDESTIVDKDRFIVWVEQREQKDGSMLWKVSRHPYSRSTPVLSTRGNWIWDHPRHRRYARHTLEKALELAYEAVKTSGPMGFSLAEWEERVRKMKRDEERRQDETVQQDEEAGDEA